MDEFEYEFVEDELILEDLHRQSEQISYLLAFLEFLKNLVLLPLPDEPEGEEEEE